MNDAEAVLSHPPAGSPGNEHSREASPKSVSGHAVVSPSPSRKLENHHDAEGEDDEDAVASVRADSEAETIIQSGREELSPQKRRMYVEHKRDRNNGTNGIDRETEDALVSKDEAKPRKRQRVESGTKRRESGGRRPSRDIHSRGPSPDRELKRERTDEPKVTSVKRGSSHPRSDGLDLSKVPVLKKRSSSEGLLPTEDRVERRRRDSAHNTQHNAEHGDLNSTSYSRRAPNNRSASPAVRTHKRITSVPSYASDIKKKRRIPSASTDIRRQSSEDRESVSSSASGSPLPTSRLRKHTSHEFSAASPVKQMPPSKKRRDQNGRTPLARACAAQEVEAAKMYYAERNDDLNVPDNAGNTPLQIASLEGCTEIVKFLIEAGCDIDTKNIDKDTPLIDAVENGHLEVVKLLLDAGANPRVGNAQGDEPYELVSSDNENYREIRHVIADAKANGPRRRRSDDQTGPSSSAKEPYSRDASAARDSPPARSQRSPPPAAATGRRRTVRSEVTRNDLLWTKATPENLQNFAAKGDMAGVANILNVGTKADTESIIAAAKGGHDEVLGILLGMGDPDPDPDPIRSENHRAGYNTPMLAAIGRGNLAVIQLLLDQSQFDPTRLDYRGRTYYEISRERKGDNWEKEYDLLKDAFDKCAASKKRKPGTTSPRRPREKDRDIRKPLHRDSLSPSSSRRKSVKSPDSQRRGEAANDAVKEKKRRGSQVQSRENVSTSGSIRTKPRRESNNSDSVMGASDKDSAHGDRKKMKSSMGRSNSDSVASGQAEETVKRRRLIAGRPPPDHMKRRESLISSDSLSGREENGKVRRERPGESAATKESVSLKRPRNSTSPDSHRRGSKLYDDDDSHDVQKKRRRIQSGEIPVPGERPQKNRGSSPSEVRPRRKSVHDSKPDNERSHKRDGYGHKETPDISPSTVESAVKEEPKKSDSRDIRDIPMEDVDGLQAFKEREATEKAAREEAMKAKEAKEKEVREKEMREREAREARELEEKRLAAEAEREKSEREAREAEEAREASEKAARLAREKAEEEERKRKEAEQRRVKQAEEERQKVMEQERLRVARVRREQEEHEQRRRDALPNRLRAAANYIGSNDPKAKSHAWLKKFFPVLTAYTKQIDPSCDPEAEREKWIPNFLAAPLLGTNDLQLSQYPSWEKRVATPTQRENLWRVTQRCLVQEGDIDPLATTIEDVRRKVAETRPKFFAMEHIFWVKLSDFMDLVPHIPHLHGLAIQQQRMYIDPEPDADLSKREDPQEWIIKSPPHCVNGDFTTHPPLTNGFSNPGDDPHH